MKNIKSQKIIFITIGVMLFISFFQIVLGPLIKKIISFYGQKDSTNLIYKFICDSEESQYTKNSFKFLLCVKEIK